MSSPPPVVLLHGWGGSFQTTWMANGWPGAFEVIGREIYPIELPGHGASASSNEADYGDLSAELDVRLPDLPVDVVGFSLGAKLALAIAARCPERFRKILIGGIGDNVFAPEPNGEMVANALIDGLPEDASPGVAALVRYASIPPNTPEALAAVLRRSPNPVLAEQDLAAVRNVLLINGDADTLATPDMRLRQALPDVQTVRLSAVDHLSLPSSPTFRRLAVEFLNDAAPIA